jgi:hypothetical protein
MASYNILLYVCIFLVFVEGVVYFGNGSSCPFTDLAKKYGDEKGYVGDMFVPEIIARYTFQVFTSIFSISLFIFLLRVFLNI